MLLDIVWHVVHRVCTRKTMLPAIVSALTVELDLVSWKFRRTVLVFLHRPLIANR